MIESGCQLINLGQVTNMGYMGISQDNNYAVYESFMRPMDNNLWCYGPEHKPEALPAWVSIA